MITVKSVITLPDNSIKDTIKLIDRSGLRVAYVVDKKGKLAGVVSDSEVRKAIIKGVDINGPASAIVNRNPVVLREKQLSDRQAVRKSVMDLLKKMPDSRYILILDSKDRPKRIMPCLKLVGDKHASKIGHEHHGKTVLVVGGAGYLGSVLSRKLLAKGFKVVVLDILAFGINPVKALRRNKRFKLIEGDIRNISTITRALVGVDAVINLAAIVGDPACKNSPEMTIETNYLANKALAEACKYNQINRFLYASTCSVYGAMKNDKELTEESPLNPVSLYARSKIQSEEGIMSLIDGNFSPTILRMGTLYGYSPRMRFDLVVNTMTKTALQTGNIYIHGGGKQWRPLLHVEDAADAYIGCLKAPIESVRGEVFNIGSSGQNYQIIDIARIVLKHIPKTRLVFQGEAGDPRNYFVSFKKCKRTISFAARHGVANGVAEIKNAIGSGEIKDPENPIYYNVEG